MEFDVQLLCHFCNALIDQSHLGHHAKVEQANKQFLWETFHSCLVRLTNFQGPTEVKRSKVRPNHEILMTFNIVLFVFCNFYVILELDADLLCCFCRLTRQSCLDDQTPFTFFVFGPRILHQTDRQRIKVIIICG